MARKANISREEILSACWALLEQNRFPNIPRVAEYFAEQDGRRGSNTTLLKGIAEWEEEYREQQASKLEGLSEQLQPAMKRLERDVVSTLSQLMEEKLADWEQAHRLKKDAVQGQYQSLSERLVQLDQNHDALVEENQSLLLTSKEQASRLAHAESRYQDTLNTVRILESRLADEEKQRQTMALNLSQKEVDLIRVEQRHEGLIAQNDALQAENNELKQRLASLQKELSQQREHSLGELKTQMQQVLKVLSSENNDRGDKDKQV